MITLHLSGLPHGPQPGAVEKALGKKSTDELAVMWDTFRPLRPRLAVGEVDKPEYGKAGTRTASPPPLHRRQAAPERRRAEPVPRGCEDRGATTPTPSGGTQCLEGS